MELQQINNISIMAPGKINDDSNDLFLIKSINSIIIFTSPDQKLMTYDLFFNELWNDEINTILKFFKNMKKYKIEKLNISFKIKNIHIELKQKNC